jgi:hypothetical protein
MSSAIIAEADTKLAFGFFSAERRLASALNSTTVIAVAKGQIRTTPFESLLRNVIRPKQGRVCGPRLATPARLDGGAETI